MEWLQPPEYKLTLSRRYYLQRKDKPPSRRSPLPPEKTLLRSAPPEYKQLQSDPRSLSSGSRKKKKKIHKDGFLSLQERYVQQRRETSIWENL